VCPKELTGLDDRLGERFREDESFTVEDAGYRNCFVSVAR